MVLGWTVNHYIIGKVSGLNTFTVCPHLSELHKQISPRQNEMYETNVLKVQLSNTNGAPDGLDHTFD